MRLTLRTLMAYLDKTLDADDAEALRLKIEESGFATELISRIRASVENPALSAPSPDAVGPLEDANVISEYLDSTLTHEQVAEIERACLESETELAETAACHQILTMALGRRAEVSDDLRQRVHQLRASSADSAGAAATSELPPGEVSPGELTPGGSGAFSSVSIPQDEQEGLPTGSEATDDTISSHPTSAPVTPVGRADSGVSDAPTRIRSAATAADRDALQAADPAGARRDSGRAPNAARARARALAEATDYYGGSVRTSRITPWLVTLALAGALLFALAQIFEPLLDRRTAERSGGEPAELDEPLSDEVAADRTAADGANAEIDTADPERAEADADDGEAAEIETAEVITTGDAQPVDDAQLGQPPEAAAGPAVEDSSPDRPSQDAGELSADQLAGAATRPADVETTDAAGPIAGDMAEVMPSEPTDAIADAVPATDVEEVPANGTTADADGQKIPAQPADLVADGAAVEPDGMVDSGDARAPITELAKFVGSNTLLLAQDPDAQWIRLSKNQVLGSGANLIAAPTFRAPLSTVAGVDVTLVGPVQMRLLSAELAGTQPVSPKQEILEQGSLQEIPEQESVEEVPEQDSVEEISGQEVSEQEAAGQEDAEPEDIVRSVSEVTTSGQADPNRAEPLLILGLGRLILRSTDANASISLLAEGRPMRLKMPEVGTTVAVELAHQRQPGNDPRLPENREAVLQLIAVEGTTTVQPMEPLEPPVVDQNGIDPTEEAVSDAAPLKLSVSLEPAGEPISIEPNSLLTRRGNRAPSVDVVDQIPAWVEQEPADASTLQKSAREGLLALLENSPNLEIALREAIGFRRQEVGALAARTLLYLGRGDVYFGGDGVLSQPEQRNYWDVHFDALQNVINSSASAALDMQRAISLAAAADQQKLMRLLTGYSNAQLEAGGDSELVGMLNSPSMAVRVLALENLRRITGTTLYFKPWEDNALRRSGDVKKWQVRVDKDSIRWSDAE